MGAISRQEAFIDLLDEHRRIVHRVSAPCARNTQDREDLQQEVLLQLWRSYPNFAATPRPRHGCTAWP